MENRAPKRFEFLGVDDIPWTFKFCLIHAVHGNGQDCAVDQVAQRALLAQLRVPSIHGSVHENAPQMNFQVALIPMPLTCCFRIFPHFLQLGTRGALRVLRGSPEFQATPPPF